MHFDFEILVVIASFTLQSVVSILGLLIWHEFKRLQSKVDILAIHRLDCMNLFPTKESQLRLWTRLDDHEKRLGRIEDTLL
ncbi:hypothetical protein [Desulfovibrio litoralis]|uniref:Uncharacterized protein n=1 Tax=Desulfovibrio litoralis DSM 11393 TaxID=1121455 RepID=A0A1M7TIT9_9BACT|nr:hypothetical protein [Desulfovibrio litoralis]SHN70621.1 hypothetical protein SAMN02745728_02063 [Desulfovibrio litoralis DSM 11393]